MTAMASKILKKILPERVRTAAPRDPSALVAVAAIGVGALAGAMAV